ncbi:MAG: TfoX/Sxy family protein [Paracoccaceae bacterium]
MPWNASHAAAMRAALGAEPFTEKRMFGGLCLMACGHMVAGLHKGGSFFRVGPEAMATALALPGTHPAIMGQRAMRGYVETPGAAADDDALRDRLMAMALAFVKTLPPK